MTGRDREMLTLASKLTFSTPYLSTSCWWWAGRLAARARGRRARRGSIVLGQEDSLARRQEHTGQEGQGAGYKAGCYQARGSILDKVSVMQIRKRLERRHKTGFIQGLT